MVQKLRLASRKPNRKTGRKHVSSSSAGNRMVDVAAQAQAGHLEKSGILELLPPELYERVTRLLENNELVAVEAKRTPPAQLANQRIQRAALEALGTVISQLYMDAHGDDLRRALNLKRLVRWIQQQLAAPGSSLNRELGLRGYDDLVELKRSDRWWGDIIAIRSKFAE